MTGRTPSGEVRIDIVNFRFEPSKLSGQSEVIDTFNDELAADIQVSGVAVTSTTRIHKRLYIRVAIISHRSTFKDFDIFVAALLDLYQARLDASAEQ